ncbi:MAG: MerR family transcriptional regulator [Bradymonadaceae bacterium]
MRKRENPLNIGALATATGVPADTIRTWERRYGFPDAHRNGAGHRTYGIDAVEEVRLIKAVLDHGYRPSQLRDCSLADLKAILKASEPEGTATLPVSEREEGVETWMDAVLDLDQSRLQRLLRRDWATMTALEFVTTRVAPFLVRLGEAWAAGEASVYQEHFASECLLHFLNAQWRALDEHALGATLVFATASGDRHVLGLHAAALLATSRSFRAVFLGAETPVQEIRAAVAQTEALAVVMTMAEGAPTIDPVGFFKNLKGAIHGTPIILGGRGGPDDVAGVSTMRFFEEFDRWLYGI